MNYQDWLAGVIWTPEAADRWLAYAQDQISRTFTEPEELQAQLFEHQAIQQELAWRQDHPREV